VPEVIRHLVKVCERDEIDDIVGPFCDRLESLRLEWEEGQRELRRRKREGVKEDGMTLSE